jgi:hypothetical protein
MRERGRGAGWWITFGVIAFGSLFLVIGLVFAGVSVSFVVDAERAPGTVVDLEWQQSHSSSSRKNGGSNQPMAYPVVDFTSADGKPREFQDSTGSNPPSYDVGDPVEVLYRANDPGGARINGFLSLWLLPLIFSGVGLLIAGVGTAVALVSRQRSRSRAAGTKAVVSSGV